MSKPDLRLYTPDTLDFDPKPVLPFPTRWPTDPKVGPADVIQFTYLYPMPTGAPMDVLNRLEEVFARAKARNVGEGEIIVAVKKVIHSPLVALLVKATPNAVDDVVLETLKALFPLAA